MSSCNMLTVLTLLPHSCWLFHKICIISACFTSFYKPKFLRPISLIFTVSLTLYSRPPTSSKILIHTHWNIIQSITWWWYHIQYTITNRLRNIFEAISYKFLKPPTLLAYFTGNTRTLTNHSTNTLKHTPL